MPGLAENLDGTSLCSSLTDASLPTGLLAMVPSNPIGNSENCTTFGEGFQTGDVTKEVNAPSGLDTP